MDRALDDCMHNEIVSNASTDQPALAQYIVEETLHCNIVKRCHRRHTVLAQVVMV
jgi:hypothetical protein